MQLTLKVVLNLRPNEVEFYNTILHSTHDILARGIDNEDAQMEVDKEDLEEAEAVMSFIEKIGDSDKTLASESTLPTDKASPQVSEPSIPQANWDKLVAGVAEVKANQVEINKKLDLVLAFKKKVDLFLQILNKNEDQGKCNTQFTPASAKLVNEMLLAFENITTIFPCNFFFLNINLTIKTSFLA